MTDEQRSQGRPGRAARRSSGRPPRSSRSVRSTGAALRLALVALATTGRRARVLAPPLSALALLLAGGPAAAQETPREAGDALRQRLLAEGPRAALVGRARLPLYVGAARAGAINLRTDIVERDGVQVYRVHDRLDLDLPGLGAARMLVQADLRADLSAVEVVLETEEPRGQGVVSRHRVTLRRSPDGARWSRTLVRGEAAPLEEAVEDLPPDALVLTPPLGAGERLARLAPSSLGVRLSLRGLDLESGQRATWRLSIDDERPVRLAAGGARSARASLREEGAARLEALRDPTSGALLRLATGGVRAPRLVAQDPDLAWLEPEAPAPLRPVLALLRAACSGDRAAAGAALDLAALHAAAGPRAGPRETFDAVLLERLTDPSWLADRGLMVSALAAGPDDFVIEEQGDGRARVRPRAAQSGATDVSFEVEARAGAWRVVRLPR